MGNDLEGKMMKNYQENMLEIDFRDNSNGYDYGRVLNKIKQGFRFV
jgi:hypothetical protein